MKLRFTNEAASDLTNIYLYTVEQFGERQADRYHDGLEERFKQLLNRPKLGRDFGFVKAGIKRTNFESHAIYFKVVDDTLLIFRVLHQSQDPARHL